MKGYYYWFYYIPSCRSIRIIIPLEHVFWPVVQPSGLPASFVGRRVENCVRGWGVSIRARMNTILLGKYFSPHRPFPMAEFIACQKFLLKAIPAQSNQQKPVAHWVTMNTPGTSKFRASCLLEGRLTLAKTSGWLAVELEFKVNFAWVFS